MSGSASAYEILGLEPGAAPDAVERAYKQLIKRYHPDRAEGDAARAAEINQAYRELRGPTEQPFERAGQFDLAEALYAQRQAGRHPTASRRRKPRMRLVLLVAIAVLTSINRGKLQTLVSHAAATITTLLESPGLPEDGASTSTPPPDLAGPLNRAEIAEAVREASRLVATGRQQDLMDESRTCHRALRERPTLAALDRCAAFDDAVIELENRGSVQESGAFGPSAVTARQIAAAKLIASNYEEIEDRLDRVRAEVQLLLTPPAREAVTRS
ncbi:MAG: J domain-containing protein [Sphingomicrobium sp.]